MNKVPHISESEWKIMKVLWAHSPSTAGEVIANLEGVENWKPTTVKTLISRLVKKNVIDFKKNGRTYHYYPLIEKNDCVNSESKSFLKRVYGGGIKLMFANFLELEELSKDDLDDLKRLLEDKR